ncbi:MAG: ribosomal L7Ae/L30e/S12e/Gadd45 family protein [Candidatus Aenigmarchaeota archaeon]|nr:ribosomal L7Ae/L30e/S12e/Gadd45 family protein [Candidatus Aenigmarchaeota archaeon]
MGYIEFVARLPEKKGMLGTREIAKAVKAGTVKRVIAASNCPEELLAKVRGEYVVIERFEGDSKQLGTKLGKPFSVAMVGYEN